MAAKKNRRSSPRGKRGRSRTRRQPGLLRRLFLPAALMVVLAGGGYVLWLDHTVRTQFEGKRWALPARVYAQPLELYVGRELSAARFAQELEALRYRPTAGPRGPGEVARNGELFHLRTRVFRFWDGEEPSRELRVSFSGGYLTALEEGAAGRPLELARLEPVVIGGIHPVHHEDRVLIRLHEAPRHLIDALIAVEDRSFYEHRGISLRALLRALYANLRAGEVVQGGSTLTQQLVKNFFLTNERTLWRKFNEAVMALLLEWHYDKDEILEAYLNEVYLGQERSRAIHGFGLASHFYFERPVSELTLTQSALLVALVKGPSYYDPWRHPQRARSRRDLVLEVLAQQGHIDTLEARRAGGTPLGIGARRPAGLTAYPAFVDLLRRQLRRDYREEDLATEGLHIFTTLDLQAQHALERVLAQGLAQLERDHDMEPDMLQAASVVTSPENGEVLAVVGGRDPRYAGFNRALDARRQIGSLVKPAVYLTALEQPRRYTLATLLDDGPLQVAGPGGQVWAPSNYDRVFHGHVPLYQCLAQSYNVATARLGMELGAAPVIQTLQRLGVERSMAPYPSLFLGTLELTPLEVTQMYQTLASGGFRTPLRAIRAVTAADGTPLQRYPLDVTQVVSPGPAYLVNHAL